MTRFTVNCPKEIARMEKTAKNGAEWDKKVAARRESIAPQLEAEAEAQYEAMAARAPQWVTIEGVAALQSPGSSFVAVPVSGKKSSRLWHVIDLNDRSDIYCQLTAKEVHSWLIKRAAVEG